MGGGRVVATAAKMAGIGVARGGLTGGTGFSTVPPATEKLAFMSSPSRHVSAAIASTAHQTIDDGVAVVQKPLLDDWEFAGVEEELGGGRRGGESIARVVFSGPPTLQEAKDATEELKEAIDSVYLSSQKTSSMEGSVVAGPLSGIIRSLRSSDNNVEAVQSEVSSVPKVALQAFAFLSESPAAQSVVASVASDPNVWSAVMENKDLREFLESNKTDTEEKPKASRGFLNEMKVKVVEMVHHVSAYFEGLFGVSSDEENHTTVDGKPKFSFFNDSRSIFGLAVLVIFMVVLKRA